MPRLHVLVLFDFSITNLADARVILAALGEFSEPLKVCLRVSHAGPRHSPRRICRADLEIRESECPEYQRAAVTWDLTNVRTPRYLVRALQ